MYLKNIFTLCFIFTFFLSKVSGQTDTIAIPSDTVRLTLSEAIKKGLEKNYKIQIAKKDVEIAESNNSWGRAGRLPVLTFSLSQNNVYANDPVSPTNDDRQEIVTNILSPAVNLNWVLFNGFAISTTKRNLEELQKLSEESLQVEMENTIQSIVLGYYNILLQKEKLEVLSGIMDLSRDRYDYVQTRKELGSAVTFDVLQVKNAFLRDSSNYILQKLSLDNSIRDFNKVMADTSYVFYQPTDEFEVDLKEFSFQDLKDGMYQNNKTLKLKYLSQSILENNITLQKSNRYPSLSLNAGADYANTRLRLLDDDATTNYSYGAFAGVTLSYTIFNGFNRKRNIKNAKIEREIGELEIKDLHATMDNQLLALFELYNARKQLYRVADENVNSMQLNLDIAKDKFNTGAINSFNYRDIQISYIYASFDKLEAIYSLIGSHHDLLRLTGGIISNY